MQTKKNRIVEGKMKTFHFEIRMDEVYLYRDIIYDPWRLQLWFMCPLTFAHCGCANGQLLCRVRPPISAILARAIEYCSTKLYSIRGCFQLRHNDTPREISPQEFSFRACVHAVRGLSIWGQCYTYNNNNINNHSTRFDDTCK